MPASAVSGLFKGKPLELERITPEQVGLSFEVEAIAPSDLVRLLLSQFSVKDIVLKGPDLSEIVRSIYEGREEVDA